MHGAYTNRRYVMLFAMGISLFVTIATMTVLGAITAGLFARGRNPRVLLVGLGLTLLPLSLFLTGLTTLIVNGIASLAAWVERTQWSDAMSWGAGLGGLSILLLVVAGIIPKPKQSAPKAQTKPAAPAPKAKPAVPAGKPQPATSASPQPKHQAAVDEDFDEIEALLKKRGIV